MEALVEIIDISQCIFLAVWSLSTNAKKFNLITMNFKITICLGW